MGIEIAKHVIEGIEISLEDNSQEILAALENAVKRGLLAIGETAEGYAKEEITNFPAVDTGRLRNSISCAIKEDEGKSFSYKDDEGNTYTETYGHGAEENAVYIGSNVEYALWIEVGTGIYAGTNGRPDPWVYQDDEGKHHLTRGVKPVHYLKKAATEHAEEYSNLMKDSIRNA